VSSGHSIVGSLLLQDFITMSKFRDIGFTMLRLGTTIDDGGTSERSDVP